MHVGVSTVSKGAHIHSKSPTSTLHSSGSVLLQCNAVINCEFFRFFRNFSQTNMHEKDLKTLQNGVPRNSLWIANLYKYYCPEKMESPWYQGLLT